MNKWISVVDRIPENGENVLCCGAHGGMFVGWFVGNQFPEIKAHRKATAYVHGGNGRMATHWMPLPEKPREDE